MSQTGLAFCSQVAGEFESDDRPHAMPEKGHRTVHVRGKRVGKHRGQGGGACESRFV